MILEPALRALARRRSVSLCYHGLGRSTAAADPHFLMVRPDLFRAQVECLLGAGFSFVTVAELATQLPDGLGPPPPGLVALSFDDGTDDNHSILLPILREYGVTATIYMTTGFIGRPNPWMDPSTGVRHMTEDELRAVDAAGIEIGAHTVNHPDLATLARDECLREMTESRDTLAAIIGKPVTTFAYPFCSYGPAALAAVADAGFAAAVTCHRRGGWQRFELQRTMITGKDGMASFALKTLGAYEPLFHSGAGRAVRAATRGLRSRARSARES